MSPSLIVDAGANTGMASLFFASIYPTAKIIAIEPEASNFELLRENCASWENITPIRAAVWPTDANVVISNQDAEKWAFSVTLSSDVNAGIPTITIPQIIAQNEVNHIDLLKLDIEGAEHELFGESSEVWLPSVKFIAIELHDRFNKDCSHKFYSKMVLRRFVQEVCGENIFLKLDPITNGIASNEHAANDG
jgi:FkbM family methyltransferase